MKRIGFIILFILLFILLIVIYQFIKPKPKSKDLLSNKSQPTNTIIPIEMTTWDDPAGFQIQYPSNLQLNIHDEDKLNYAHLELTKSDIDGNIIIWAKDLPLDQRGNSLTTLDQIVTNDPILKSASKIETQIDGQKAQKLALVSEKKLITVTVFDGLLFLIEMKGSDLFWLKSYDAIISNFKFNPLNNKNTENLQNNSDSVVEEYDEIVE